MSGSTVAKVAASREHFTDEQWAEVEAENDAIAAALLGFCWRLWGTVCGESPWPVAPTVPRAERGPSPSPL